MPAVTQPSWRISNYKDRSSSTVISTIFAYYDLLYWHGHVLSKQDPKTCSQSGFHTDQLKNTDCRFREHGEGNTSLYSITQRQAKKLLLNKYLKSNYLSVDTNTSRAFSSYLLWTTTDCVMTTANTHFLVSGCRFDGTTFSKACNKSYFYGQNLNIVK